jgi:hypothetical protein
MDGTKGVRVMVKEWGGLAGYSLVACRGIFSSV